MVVCMLVVQYQTQDFRQKVAKETRSNVWKYLPTIKKRTSRCLVQGQKQYGKILKKKFATNLLKQNNFAMFTRVYLWLNLFIFVYTYLLVFTYVYLCLPLLTGVLLCLPLFTTVYSLTIFATV